MKKMSICAVTTALALLVSGVAFAEVTLNSVDPQAIGSS